MRVGEAVTLALGAGLLALASTVRAEEGRAVVCPGDPPGIACFKSNLDAIYAEGGERFWRAFEAYRARAAACDDPKATAEFLDLAYFVRQNAEASQAFGQASQQLLLADSGCFLGAAIRLRSASLRPLVRRYLREPPPDDPSAIRTALERHRAEPDYARAVELYFEDGS
jgi:hypothetical protein